MSVPDAGHAIKVENLVARDDGDGEIESLRDQQPAEGIAMVKGQKAG